MTPGTWTQPSPSYCVLCVYYPGGLSLGVSFLMLLLALQRIIAPLDPRVPTGLCIFVANYTVCSGTEEWFPWSVRLWLALTAYYRSGSRAGHPSVF